MATALGMELCDGSYAGVMTKTIPTRTLTLGDRVQLSGGYDFEPAWLGGKDNVEGTVIAFIPGQNIEAAAVIKLDQNIDLKNGKGDIAVLELRYVEAKWERTDTVHIELCDFMPEATSWKDRPRGLWVESHATYRIIGD